MPAWRGVSYQASRNALLISGPAEFLNSSQHVQRQNLEFPQIEGTMMGIHRGSHWTVKLLFLSEQCKSRRKAQSAPRGL